MIPVLRSQEECIEVVKERIYRLPVRLRKIAKQLWKHLYE